MTVHVDDSLVGGSTFFWTDVFPEVKNDLLVGSEEEMTLDVPQTFVGKEIILKKDPNAKKNPWYITLSLDHYVKKIQPLEIKAARPKSGDGGPFEDLHEYRKRMG